MPSDPPDDPNSPWIPKQETSAEEWWDFPRATDAAKMLLTSVPAMLAHWEQLRWAPETSAGYEAIKALGDALSLALPYIEWPFGEYKRQWRPKRPKNWHTPAILVAGIIVKATTRSEKPPPSIHRKSIVVRVVREALGRIGYGNVEVSAISKHMTRWNEKWGIPGMTTK